MPLTKSEIVPVAFWMAAVALGMATSLSATVKPHGLQASKAPTPPSFSASALVQAPPAADAADGVRDVVMRVQ